MIGVLLEIFSNSLSKFWKFPSNSSTLFGGILIFQKISNIFKILFNGELKYLENFSGRINRGN